MPPTHFANFIERLNTFPQPRARSVTTLAQLVVTGFP